jgi:Sulfotransferase family
MRTDPLSAVTHTPTNRATSPAAEAAPRGRERREGGPIFIAGPDRSGTTLIYALLASHPDISMVRRTNMWRYFHLRYGDLGVAANLDRCLNDMITYRRMRHLEPDVDRIRKEFGQGPPTYARLFSLFHEHNAERAGKRRWGDKSLHTEHYASRVFAEFPDARIIHMVRDPRDRYASVRKRWGGDVSRVGAATGRWLTSTRAGHRNRTRDPDRYLMLRYEDLAREPEATMRMVCSFIGAEFSPSMLAMGAAPEHRDSGGNSSFGDVEPGAISTRAIGRFRQVLSPSELAFIQLLARREMADMDYQRERVLFTPAMRLRYLAWDLPIHLARLVGALTIERLDRRRGQRVPASKVDGS